MVYQNSDVCPICGEKAMNKKNKEEVFTYKGHNLTIPNYPIYECDECGEELIQAQDSKKFEKDRTDFRRGVDGLLTSEEIRNIRKSFDCSQKEFAEMLQVGEKNFARYENGAATQSRAMDSLLRILRDYPFSISSIVEKNKVPMNKEIILDSTMLLPSYIKKPYKRLWNRKDFESKECRVLDFASVVNG